MNKLRFFATSFFSSLLLGGVLNASVISLNEQEDIIKTACIYHFCENPDEDVEDFFSVDSIPQDLLGAKLKERAPIHINLIDRGFGDAVLEELIPYAPLIYGLSLEGNFFTNESLEIIAGKFSELRYLDLKNNRLKKPLLEPLLTLPHLSTLELTYNKVDESEIMQFKKQKPNCAVVF